MARYVAIRDGGKTSEEGAMRLFNKVAGTQNKGKIGTGDFLVSQNGTPNMTINVAVGDVIIPYLNYIFHCWSDAIENVAVDAANPSNPRIDRVVAYVDLAVVSSTNSNNPNALKLKAVAGSPAGSPTRPNDAAVQTSVGAGNPFVDLADLSVSANDTSIVTNDITDTRSTFQIGGLAGIIMTQLGTCSVSNDVSPIVIAPKPGSFSTLYARVKTAPTGANLIARVNKNGAQVGTVTINAGSTSGTTTGLSIPVAAGDYFTLDVTQIGSSVAGANLSVVAG